MKNINRRELLIGGAALTGATLIGEKFLQTRESFAQEMHWADNFIWVAPDGGIPGPESSLDGKFGVFDALINPGETGVGVFSQFSYPQEDPFTGKPLFIPGRENHPLVVVATGSRDGVVNRLFGDMPVKGGWFGKFLNPGGATSLSDAQLYEAVSVRIAALRNPRLNNCAVGVGCQGPIEYVVIDSAGAVSDHGVRRR